MGSHHSKARRYDHGRSLPVPEAGPGSADPAVESDLEAAAEHYRAAAERYAVAKYEYKAAKYALKAARLREATASGRSGKHGYRKHGKYRDDHRALSDRGGRHHGVDYPDDRRQGGNGATMPDTAHGDPGERRKGGQVVLQIVETERIGEHMQRITLGGEGFEDFRDNRYTDKYVKILFADPALGLEPPYDVQALRRSLPKHQRPVRRTYTVHSVDPAARTLAIDVVLHGDSGVAGRWAARAQVGEKVAFSGPGGKYAPDPRADWHLLAGDESALPAIEAALSSLPSDTVGIALIEVAGPADERTLEHPAGVEMQWLHREPTAGPVVDPAARLGGRTPSPLVAAVESMAWRPGRVHAFVHGEKSAVKRLRRHLLEERRVDKRMLSLSSYWTRGSSED
jgi:NADPH-dependent ferric siderophore reductase